MNDKEMLELAAKAAGVEVVTPTMLEYGKWNPLTDDGCTVYRFEDAGRNRCFVKCENGSDSTITSHSAGKSSFPETIQTEVVEQ